MKDESYIKIENKIKKCYDEINEYKQVFLQSYFTYTLDDVIGLYNNIKRMMSGYIGGDMLTISMNINLNKEYDKLNKSLEKQLRPLFMKVLKEE